MKYQGSVKVSGFKRCIDEFVRSKEEYLNELSRDMLDYNYQIWTGNHMLDMILNQKEKEAEKQKTQMQISTEVFTTLPFSDREIISLFGNLLDNALEACEQIKEGERWIHIKMKKKNQLLYIEIVNAAKNMGIQTDENFCIKKGWSVTWLWNEKYPGYCRTIQWNVSV